jgi:uncharacterized protein (DUF433 family)
VFNEQKLPHAALVGSPRNRLILDLLASGMKDEEVLTEYPQLTAEDIQACLAYASEMTRERTVHIA